MTLPAKNSLFTTLILLIGGTIAPPAVAVEVDIPVALNYRILEQALAEQVFTETGTTLEVFADDLRCNFLVLSDPRVGPGEDGEIRVLTAMHARTGTPLGGKCRLAKSWEGQVETLQTAQVDPDSSRIAFHVVESALVDPADGKDVLPRFMRRWVRDYVHPRFSAVSIDLRPAMSGIGELLAMVEPAGPAIRPAALALTRVVPSPDALVVMLALEVPESVPSAATIDEAPLTQEELAEWDRQWQAWDGFATWLIKTLAVTADPELTQALAETLLEARYDLRDALARDDRDRDPVRALFLQTWERLAPLVRDIQLDLPGSQALPFATFISAGDALTALDRLAPHMGFRLDREALRQMARTLVPGVTDYQMRYDTAIDPEVRELLGLDPQFEVDAENGALAATIAWLIRSAHAAQIRPELVKQLNNWVPRRKDVDRYLLTMEQLLDAISAAERDQGKVPARYLDLYDALLRATAWQESCWRQYVEREGAIETIRSSAGSVGLMQINMHVWRGVYDIDKLLGDVAYNARAGNEILVHYLVDYAIRKGEHEINDDPEDLARATYAVYNGGPRHLARYRNPDTSASLKKIDHAFWEKYRAIQKEGPLAVRRCLTGS
ncbi:transglycosylase SLT domain-containing protein [Elongatibacter sediminis]|uniref:Transglycosylase SLT domain-containing protein n=1 Tax=Elongatibacter sediminis TaxID=3119006 RepID=A0AAW9R9U0_9GAMM